jgi:hypothetical protein
MSDGEFSNNCSRINKSFILLASSSFCGNGPISSASIHWYLEKLKIEKGQTPSKVSDSNAKYKGPKVPKFEEGQDIDSYLHTFEKLALQNSLFNFDIFFRLITIHPCICFKCLPSTKSRGPSFFLPFIYFSFLFKGM